MATYVYIKYTTLNEKIEKQPHLINIDEFILIYIYILGIINERLFSHLTKLHLFVDL